MSIYGYARVSTFDQDFSIQHAALKAAGCEVIHAETASGTGRDGRTELQAMLEFLRPVTRLSSPALIAWPDR
jgi:DNA invertase Pin-like site-specific DNA recombinase